MASNNAMDVAMDWVVVMKSSEKADLMRAQFEVWLGLDPAHRCAYEHASRYWDRLERAAALLRQGNPSTPEALLGEIAEVTQRARRRRDVKSKVQRWSIRVACVLAVSALVLIGRHVLGPPEAAVAAWTAYDGIQTHQTLSDGSELYLNGRSAAARVRMGPHAREIALDRGQILINVRRGDARPLFVETSDWVIRATGTQFAVRRVRTGVLEVTVQEGTVRIDPVNSFWPVRLLSRGDSAHSGQAAMMEAGRVQVSDRDPFELERELAWTRGWLYLRGTLEQAVAQFNEYNERGIIIADPSISKMDVAGLYAAHALKEFAESLRSRHVRYELGGAIGGKRTIRLYSE